MELGHPQYPSNSKCPEPICKARIALCNGIISLTDFRQPIYGLVTVEKISICNKFTASLVAILFASGATRLEGLFCWLMVVLWKGCFCGLKIIALG